MFLIQSNINHKGNEEGRARDGQHGRGYSCQRNGHHQESSDEGC